MAHFIAAFYDKQAEKYGGETSVNELRVIAQCYLDYTLGLTSSVTQLARELNMPMSTVHRGATNLIKKGWLFDQPNPADQRCRIISLTDQAVSGGLWQVALGWLKEYSDEVDGDESSTDFVI